MLKPSGLRIVCGVLAGLILLLIAAWLSGSTGQICEYNQSTHQNECPSYNLAFFFILKGGEIINYYGPLIAALATIAIAFFTYTLKQSTDKLWIAGENQLIASREIAAQQSRDMRESTNVGRMGAFGTVNAAKAAQKSADSATRQAKVAEDALFTIERPYVLIANLSPIKQPTTAIKNEKISIISDYYVTYKVGNFGRMAALIHEIRHVFQVADSKSVPDNPFSMVPPHRVISEGFDAGYAIAAGEIIDDQYFTLPKHVEIVEKNGFLDPKLSSGKTVFMFARVRYEDVGADSLVRDRISTWKYDFSVHHFLKCGGKQHNYEKNVDETA